MPLLTNSDCWWENDLRNSRWWDKEIETGLPDCRVSYTNRDKQRVIRGRMVWEMVYCASCSKLHGLATVETPHIFFVCDACVTKQGPPPGCKEVKVNVHDQRPD